MNDTHQALKGCTSTRFKIRLKVDYWTSPRLWFKRVNQFCIHGDEAGLLTKVEVDEVITELDKEGATFEYIEVVQ